MKSIHHKPLILIVALCGLVTIVSVAAAFFLYRRLGEQNWRLLQLRQQGASGSAETLSASEVKDLVARVGKLIVLPANEEPTVATVTDPELLRGQAFFARAKKGDKVLIYARARKAVLYDPVANLILEVAPVNPGKN